MKPLGFALEEMRELLGLLADLDADASNRAQLLDRLRMFHEAATARVTALREQLAVAKGFADSLTGHLDARHRRPEGHDALRSAAPLMSRPSPAQRHVKGTA